MNDDGTYIRITAEMDRADLSTCDAIPPGINLLLYNPTYPITERSEKVTSRELQTTVNTAALALETDTT